MIDIQKLRRDLGYVAKRSQGRPKSTKRYRVNYTTKFNKYILELRDDARLNAGYKHPWVYFGRFDTREEAVTVGEKVVATHPTLGAVA